MPYGACGPFQQVTLDATCFTPANGLALLEQIYNLQSAAGSNLTAGAAIASCQPVIASGDGQVRPGAAGAAFCAVGVANGAITAGQTNPSVVFSGAACAQITDGGAGCFINYDPATGTLVRSATRGPNTVGIYTGPAAAGAPCGNARVIMDQGLRINNLFATVNGVNLVPAPAGARTQYNQYVPANLQTSDPASFAATPNGITVNQAGLYLVTADMLNNNTLGAGANPNNAVQYAITRDGVLVTQASPGQGNQLSATGPITWVGRINAGQVIGTSLLQFDLDSEFRSNNITVIRLGA